MATRQLRSLQLFVGLLLAWSLAAAPLARSAPPPPAARCLAAKTLAAGIEARAAIVCAQRSLPRFLDTDCLGKRSSRRDASFAAAEARGGCAQVDDSFAVGAEVVSLNNALLAALRPGGPAASRCTAAQLGAASRAIAQLARAYARDDASPDAALLATSIAAAYTRFDTAFARAARRGDCLSATDPAGARAIVARGIARIRGTLVPSCGDGVRAGSEICDGEDLSRCPQACGADCTCSSPPPVCGNGVIEDGEECDGGTICRNRKVGEYGCYAPPADDACQCCATTAPCYVRGYGNAVPSETPCCSGTCDIPGPEAGPDAIAFCSGTSSATCPCWTAATIDATFPSGYFAADGRGGASCLATGGGFGLAAADSCDVPTPAGDVLTTTRAGAAVVALSACGIFADIDPQNDGYCDLLPSLTTGISSREGAACLAELTASQAYRSACP
jgi:hypothetical protein